MDGILMDSALSKLQVDRLLKAILTAKATPQMHSDIQLESIYCLDCQAVLFQMVTQEPRLFPSCCSAFPRC